MVQQKLSELGVRCNRTPNSLEYILDNDFIDSKNSEDQRILFKDIASSIGLDIYNNTSDCKKDLSVDVKVHYAYKCELFKATKDWSNNKTLKNIQSEKTNIKSYIGGCIVFGTLITYGVTEKVGAYIGEHWLHNESQGKLAIGVVVGASIAYGIYALLSNSIKDIRTYNSRVGAKKLYNALK